MFKFKVLLAPVLLTMLASFSHAAPNMCHLLFKASYEGLTKADQLRLDNSKIKIDQTIDLNFDLDFVKNAAIPEKKYNEYVHKFYYHKNFNPLSWSWYTLNHLGRWTYMTYRGAPSASFYQKARQDALFFASPEIRQKMSRLKEVVEGYVEQIVKVKNEISELELEVDHLKQYITESKKEKILDLQMQIESQRLKLESYEEKQKNKNDILDKISKNSEFRKSKTRIKRLVRQLNTYDARINETIKLATATRLRAYMYWKAFLSSRIFFYDKVKYTHLVIGKKNTSNGKYFEVVGAPRVRDYLIRVKVPVYNTKLKQFEFEDEYFKTKWHLFHSARVELSNAVRYSAKVPVLSSLFSQREVLKLERQQAETRGELEAVYVVLERLRLKNKLNPETTEELDKIDTALREHERTVSRRAKFWLSSKIFWAEHKSFYNRSYNATAQFIDKYFNRDGGAEISQNEFTVLLKDAGIAEKTRSSLPVTVMTRSLMAVLLSSSGYKYHQNLFEYVQKSYDTIDATVMNTAYRYYGVDFNIKAITHKDYNSTGSRTAEEKYGAARNKQLYLAFGSRYKKFSEGKLEGLSSEDITTYVTAVNEFRKERALYLLSKKLKSIDVSKDKSLISVQSKLVDKLSEVSFFEAEAIVEAAKIVDNNAFSRVAAELLGEVTRKYDNNKEISDRAPVDFDSYKVQRYILNILHALNLSEKVDFATAHKLIDDLMLGERGSMTLRALIEDKYEFDNFRAKKFSFQTEYSIEKNLLEARKAEVSVYFFNKFIKDHNGDAIDILSRALELEQEAYNQYLNENPVLKREVINDKRSVELED